MRPKKSLGQNFLTSKKFVGNMVTAAALSQEDTVLEIGPGKGILTEALLENAGHVIAIEKDGELVQYLKEKFKEEIANNRFTLMHADVLSVDIDTVVDKTYKLVANIPYYITGLLMRHFLEGKHQPSSMTLLVQKEVAERIVARDQKESLLSMSVKVYGTPRIIAKVPARYFNPAPKIDSSILHIEHISKEFFDTVSEVEFFKIIKAGFEHKRKMLLGNLSPLYSKDMLITAFDRCTVSKNTRAENIAREQWKCLLINLKI